jgi:hypothetical protein
VGSRGEEKERWAGPAEEEKRERWRCFWYNGDGISFSFLFF